MNELTKDKIIYWNDTEKVNYKDVILAVEETIKRIEDQIIYFEKMKDYPFKKSHKVEIQGYINGLNYSKKIIKEQFPILSDGNQSQESEK